MALARAYLDIVQTNGKTADKSLFSTLPLFDICTYLIWIWQQKFRFSRYLQIIQKLAI